ncbi:MAG: CHASE2 domain-containing protein [Myxococcota bacterium]|nr:CHASE2 domain-containing protein [Myxococcota bacterium]
MRADAGLPLERHGPSLVAALVGLALLASGLLAPLDRLATDTLLRLSLLRPPTVPETLPDVAIVALDAQSLRAIPSWPWPREHHAALVDRLTDAGATAVAFDLDFSTPRPGEDAVLADALRRSGQVHLAAFRQIEDLPGIGELEVVNRPAPELAEAAAGIGHVVVSTDADGAVRRGPATLALGGVDTPSLAHSTLDGVLRAADAPIEETRELRFDYRRALPEIPRIPAIDVLEGRFDEGDVAGRVVFVGATAVEFQDLWPTPLGAADPGVWIQALGHRTLAAEAAGQPVLRSALPASAAVVVLAALLASLLGRASGLRRPLGLAGVALLAGSGQLALLVLAGLATAPVPVLAALGVDYVARLEAVRRWLRRDLADREQSLTTVFEVGARGTARGEGAADGLQMGLLLLGEVIGARAVALLRATPDGSLCGERLDWNPRGERARVRIATAEGTLEGRDLRVFAGAVPLEGEPETTGPGLAVYAPLRSGDAAAGVLIVDRDDPSPLAPTQLRTIATVASQLALQARNLRLVEDLRDTLNASVEAVASAVEARDGYTEMHCRRLALFSVTMGRRLGLPEDEIEGIRLGALLHDVGKIGIPDRVLLKPGRLSDEERATMQSHTEIGHRIVAPIRGLTAGTLACVRHHHERWDGSGYPLALAGHDIPLAARIVSVVDVWDALSSARPYKPALDQRAVRELLEKGRGSQFDPDLLDLFLRVLDEEGEEMLALVAGSAGPHTSAMGGTS